MSGSHVQFYRIITVGFSCIFGGLCAPCFSQQENRVLDVLLARNEEAVGKIFAAEIEIEEQYLVFNNKPSSEKFNRAILSFDHRTKTERQRCWLLNLPQFKNGKPFNCYDMLQTSDSCRTLENWDWDRSQPIVVPANQGAVRARMGKPDVVHKAMASEIAPRFLFALRACNTCPSYSIREFIEKSSDVRCVGNIIEFVHLTPKSIGVGNMDFRIRFSDSGLVDLVEYSFLAERDRLKGYYRVDEFCEPATGEIFPKVITSELMRPSDGLISIRTQTKVNKVQLNKAVSRNAFDFRFPENVMVVDMNLQEGQTEYDLYLWGPDDKPKGKLNSVHDLPGDVHIAPRRTYIRYIWIALAMAAVAVGGYWGKRRWQRG